MANENDTSDPITSGDEVAENSQIVHQAADNLGKDNRDYVLENNDNLEAPLSETKSYDQDSTQVSEDSKTEQSPKMDVREHEQTLEKPVIVNIYGTACIENSPFECVAQEEPDSMIRLFNVCAESP